MPKTLQTLDTRGIQDVANRSSLLQRRVYQREIEIMGERNEPWRQFEELLTDGLRVC